MKTNRMFSGIFKDLALCHAAPSHTKTILSLGYVVDRCSRKMFIQFVLQYGITKKQLSPVIGSTAP